MMGGRRVDLVAGFGIADAALLVQCSVAAVVDTLGIDPGLAAGSFEAVYWRVEVES